MILHVSYGKNTNMNIMNIKLYIVIKHLNVIIINYINIIIYIVKLRYIIKLLN